MSAAPRSATCHLRLVHSRRPLLSAVHLAQFAEPKTWAEIYALEPRLTRRRWLDAIIDADEHGWGHLAWTPGPDARTRKRDRLGRWGLTERGRAYINRVWGGHMTSIYVPHVTASGSLRRRWEYVPTGRRLVVAYESGSLDVHFAIEVCSRERPAFGACTIVRVDEERWRVLPERYVRTWPEGVEALVPLAQPIASSLGHGVSLLLTNAPDDVSALLERL